MERYRYRRIRVSRIARRGAGRRGGEERTDGRDGVRERNGSPAVIVIVRTGRDGRSENLNGKIEIHEYFIGPGPGRPPARCAQLPGQRLNRRRRRRVYTTVKYVEQSFDLPSAAAAAAADNDKSVRFAFFRARQTPRDIQRLRQRDPGTAGEHDGTVVPVCARV